MSLAYSTPEFESLYTYYGNDLGSSWSREKTCFRLWAPTADAVSVRLYRSGDASVYDALCEFSMHRDICGTWCAEYTADLNGVYYTYLVTHGNETTEACDPYARTTGINGMRAMVIDLKSTDPTGWDSDTDPNAGHPITDAIIYELHIRDLSAHSSSGIRSKGKFLGVIETGTTTPSGIPTGLDHIKSLGVTHLQLLPVYDYGSIDESLSKRTKYNWGYDPLNYNVPEGSYSTDPYDGAVRVREMKQMVKGLHDNGISVVMDVVYNHVYDAPSFCFNKIVPGYFSRISNGIYSNGSGCGNDTASERSMVRKYIVDSVCYWADEYHIDGFRFDLVGLIDIRTINEVVESVHETHPNVIFYGEGWDLSTEMTLDIPRATQTNSTMTPGFAYFNDSIRDTLRGSVFSTDALGFITGDPDAVNTLHDCFKGIHGWCCEPAQTVNYVSCHDNHTLIDRIALAATEHSFEEQVRMNNLAAAFCMLAQGIPFFQAGEEILRSKRDGKGNFVANSYKSPDSVNSIKWNHMDQRIFRETFEYYKGLIAFRKAHPVLRLKAVYDVLSHVIALPWDDPRVCAFRLNGDVIGESSEEILAIFNASEETQTMHLPKGKWNICINAHYAGTFPIHTVEQHVLVDPIGVMVLVKEKKQ